MGSGHERKTVRRLGDLVWFDTSTDELWLAGNLVSLRRAAVVTLAITALVGGTLLVPAEHLPASWADAGATQRALVAYAATVAASVAAAIYFAGREPRAWVFKTVARESEIATLRNVNESLRKQINADNTAVAQARRAAKRALRSKRRTRENASLYLQQSTLDHAEQRGKLKEIKEQSESAAVRAEQADMKLVIAVDKANVLQGKLEKAKKHNAELRNALTDMRVRPLWRIPRDAVVLADAPGTPLVGALRELAAFDARRRAQRAELLARPATTDDALRAFERAGAAGRAGLAATRGQVAAGVYRARLYGTTVCVKYGGGGPLDTAGVAEGGGETREEAAERQEAEQEVLVAYQREMDTMCRVRHPNVLAFIGVIECARPLLVFEYTPRGDLFELLLFHGVDFRPSTFRGTPDCNESAALHSYGLESHCRPVLCDPVTGRTCTSSARTSKCSTCRGSSARAAAGAGTRRGTACGTP